MEEKRRDSTGTPPTPATDGHNPDSEPLTASRRRGGSQKRKSASINSGSGGSDSQAASSKRQAREKPPVVPFPPIHLNGPFTRARVQPTNGNSLSLEAVDAKVELEAKAEELRRVSENWEELEAGIEAEYEAVISRDANAHVVPVHAGWFSWNKIHTLEERMMPSFFNGKLECRTPEIYMEIRNWIMKKFHFNPNSQIELEQLSELTVGDSDARQEVMEFLDYWGLINYHPFPHNEPVAAVTVDDDDDDDDYDDDEAREKDSLVEKLFQFETVQSWTPVVTRTNMEIPSTSSGLLPESVIAEELNKSEGPSVGYHCNSCSTDCSRKRYHCQKQADFDLCAECFNNGKFDSDMSPSDFILMESAEAGGASGGKWTDQETLLLLEAIELFKDNWSEIAEHVATKTKAQCILHFVQMPIEDVFFNSDDKNDVVPEENGLAVSITEYSSPKTSHDIDTAVKDVPEKTENEGDATDNQSLSSPMEISNPEEEDDSDKTLEFMENFTHKALKDAFEAVGSLSSPGDKLSFAEAGNPVMVLAAFLVRLVEPNIASASVHSFLKAFSAKHSSEQLAARHCLPLEDHPPDDKKNLAGSAGAATKTVEDEIRRDVNEHVEKQNEETPDSAVEDIRVPDDDKEENKESTSGEHKGKNDSSEKKLVDKSKFPRKRSLKDAGASGVLASNTQLNFNHVKESENGGAAVESGQSKAPRKDEKLTSNSEKKDTAPLLKSNSVAEKEKTTGDKEAKEHVGKTKNSLVTKNDLDINKLKRAAVTALSAAAVKAKLLAEEEENQIRQLAILLVEKQLHKLETKLAFFGDLENVVLHVKEQLDRSKQRLFQERAQIIATRLGMPASARPTSQHLPPNRAAAPAANFPNQALRPFMGTNTQKPPISRPIMAPNPASSTLMPVNAAGSSTRPNSSDKFSSFSAK